MSQNFRAVWKKCLVVHSFFQFICNLKSSNMEIFKARASLRSNNYFFYLIPLTSANIIKFNFINFLLIFTNYFYQLHNKNPANWHFLLLSHPQVCSALPSLSVTHMSIRRTEPVIGASTPPIGGRTSTYGRTTVILIRYISNIKNSQNHLRDLYYSKIILRNKLRELL